MRMAEFHLSTDYADFADFTNRFLGSQSEDARETRAQQEETQFGERELGTSVSRWARDPKVGPFRIFAPQSAESAKSADKWAVGSCQRIE
jgi:hypothetical protein